MWRGLLRCQSLNTAAMHISTHTKLDMKPPCVRIPCGSVGLGQAFTYRKLAAVIWTGIEGFALIKASEYFNPCLALSGHRSFADKPQVLTVKHSSSRRANIWKAFSLDKQYLTAWKPTAVLLRLSQTQVCEAAPCLSALCCGCMNPLQLKGIYFHPSWTAQL